MLKNVTLIIAMLLPVAAASQATSFGVSYGATGDSARKTTAISAVDLHEPSIGGNLPKVLKARQEPYVVTADLYVPSGKTVVIEPGSVLLFSNFTGLHVEGRLVAEGTPQQPVVFSSVFDQTYNTRAPMHANPYDWDGIYIHEGGIGSNLANCTIMYSVYGISSLTKYIRFDNVLFRSNGRADLTIEGLKHPVTTAPYSYALTVADASKDGVPIKILMDPLGKKRNMLRYCGIGLFAAGCVTGIWGSVQASHDASVVQGLRDTRVTDINANLIQNTAADYDRAMKNKNRDQGWAVTGFALAVLGATGLCLSFTF
jgi:hypothetical protein